MVKFNGFFSDSGQRGPYNLYKPCKRDLYIIIFSHIDKPDLQITINLSKNW